MCGRHAQTFSTLAWGFCDQEWTTFEYCTVARSRHVIAVITSSPSIISTKACLGLHSHVSTRWFHGPGRCNWSYSPSLCTEKTRMKFILYPTGLHCRLYYFQIPWLYYAYIRSCDLCLCCVCCVYFEVDVTYIQYAWWDEPWIYVLLLLVCTASFNMDFYCSTSSSSSSSKMLACPLTVSAWKSQGQTRLVWGQE